MHVRLTLREVDQASIGAQSSIELDLVSQEVVECAAATLAGDIDEFDIDVLAVLDRLGNEETAEPPDGNASRSSLEADAAGLKCVAVEDRAIEQATIRGGDWRAGPCRRRALFAANRSIADDIVR